MPVINPYIKYTHTPYTCVISLTLGYLSLGDVGLRGETGVRVKSSRRMETKVSAMLWSTGDGEEGGGRGWRDGHCSNSSTHST